MNKSDTQRTFLITGSMGCIGAWTLYHLVNRGEKAVSFDLSENRARLDLLLSRDEQAAITFVTGDLTAYEQVHTAIADHDVTHIVHLAALQVPFCRAEPVLGAQVNVVGTVNVFEAAHQNGLQHLAYASSIAVYGSPEEYPSGLLPADALPKPHTLYGVYKVAGEGIAHVYWREHKFSSTGLRPYTVYGLGRDQGLTSEPTRAMLAAASGQTYHISFGGTMQFQWASDVAQQFIDAAILPLAGAQTFNLGGDPTTVAQVAAIINRLRPGVRVTAGETPLPFPKGFDDSTLRQHLPTVYQTPLTEGIAHTLDAFSARLADGRLTL